MTSIVVDTNVLAVADGRHDGASEHCVLACLAIVQRVADGQCVAVDSSNAILSEYLLTVAGKGRFGPAAKLVKKLWDQRWNPDVCCSVEITLIDDPAGSFAEVPAVLQDFDIDDHKFIAVARALGAASLLYQALDREWWVRRADFVAAGILVQFPCSADLLVAA